MYLLGEVGAVEDVEEAAVDAEALGPKGLLQTCVHVCVCMCMCMCACMRMCG